MRAGVEKWTSWAGTSLKEQGGGPHPNEKSMQYGECNQQATSDHKRVIPGHYNPS